MQRLGLAFLAYTLVIGATGSASAGQARDEAAIRALGDTFAKAFVQKNVPSSSIRNGSLQAAEVSGWRACSSQAPHRSFQF
jgi:hypothetical protein